MNRVREQGFTLVEIMIVVAIIAILSAIAIPNFMTARSKSRAVTCRGNLRQIDAAIQQVAMDTLLADGSTTTITAFVPTYIKVIPICKASGNYGATVPLGAVNPPLPVGFTQDVFIIGCTPWCDIGSTPKAGNYPHVLWN